MIGESSNNDDSMIWVAKTGISPGFHPQIPVFQPQLKNPIFTHFPKSVFLKTTRFFVLLLRERHVEVCFYDFSKKT